MFENNTVDKGLFTFDTYALQLQEVDSERFQGQTLIVNLGSIENIDNLSGGIPNNSLILHDMIVETLNNATASVQLPGNLFKSLANCNETNASESTSTVPTRLSYSVFLSDVLFQSTEFYQNRLGSIIVSALG